MWGPVASRVLFRLNRLGLWPNHPVWGCRHIRGRSTKVEVEIVLQEELIDIIRDLNLSEVKSHLGTFVQGGLKHPYPLRYCFKGTLWWGGQILDKGWVWRITNICKNYYLHIKCFPVNSLTVLMWKWYLNNKQAALQLVVEGLGRCEMRYGETPIT